MVIRFAGFELDLHRAELRRPDGAAIRLRAKSFAMLRLFAANAGRVVSKQELMDAVWPNIHVGEDSLFQCIREIRTALGDDQRQLVKTVSGRGYLFEAEVLRETDDTVASEQAASSDLPAAHSFDQSIAPMTVAEPVGRPRFYFRRRGPATVAILGGLCAIIGLAIAAPIFRPSFLFDRSPQTIVVMPIVAASHDADDVRMATSVTERLTDGLAKIGNIRVVSPLLTAQTSTHQTASARSERADLVLNGELQRNKDAWTLQARLLNTATGEVQWTTSVSVASAGTDSDVTLQQSRLAAGIGHPLALRINALMNFGTRSKAADSQTHDQAKVVIEQAMASINQTTPERFKAAQAMLQRGLGVDPDNVDLQAALASLLLRGIQMDWYPRADVAGTENSARAMLERALQIKPTYLPVLEGNCRFLAATNHFVESLVACANALSFDPWDGLAMFNLGLAQIQLGRFEDALATFQQADHYNTPQVSRWTWLLGAGWTCMMMGRDEEALPWLQRSLAITPGTGRTHLLLAAAYQRLGRPDEAKAALAKALELRPHTTARNSLLPTKNTSPVYLEALEGIVRAEVDAGLPES